MLAVIFEVHLSDGRREEYLSIASELRSLLASIDGFISIERFSSLNEEGKILSLSFWRDEEAIQRWRKLEEHRQAQGKGISRVFKDYRLRVAEVCRDYSMSDRAQAPKDSTEYHD